MAPSAPPDGAIGQAQRRQIAQDEGMSRILMPLPDRDFDPTESAVPWTMLSEAGHEVTFATQSGQPGQADPLVLDGLPFGLGARRDALDCYARMTSAPEYAERTVRWDEVDPEDYDGLFLTGGHAAGMRPFLESEHVQAMVRSFFARDLPVGAICHGVLAVARTRDASGRPILEGRRSTCLPRYMEALAYYITAWKLGRYYRTYDAYVEQEVREALGPAGVFERGPIHLFSRGSRRDDGPAFVVEDGAYVSGRWPGDAWAIARRFESRLPRAAEDAAHAAHAA
jgi:putative intracellular protease/amidase